MFIEASLQSQIFFTDASLHNRIVPVFQKIRIGRIPTETVGNMNIFPTVIIKICKKDAPTPIGFRYACHLPDLAEERLPPVIDISYTIIQLQHIVNELRLVTFFL